jgi:predicted flap endonuclease-1-like 5' DNA nuclease
MQQQNSGIVCPLGSWALAAGAGLLVFILLLVIGGWGVTGAIFMGGLAFVVLGLVFSWIFCRDLSEARGPGNIEPTNSGEAAAGAPPAKSSTAAPAPAAAAAPAAKADPAPAAKTDPAPAASEAKPDVSAASAAADAEAGAQIKPSARLAGQEDLAARKGAWKYEAAPKPAATKAAKAKAAPAAAATPDYDGDGKAEGANEGAKPATLSEAREGGADNLKEIKGVGPKLEKLLNSMGFYHFDQIANWTADEVAWVNANLEGFKGRVSRDNWVEQAKILAAGGETEFSKRVDKGGVY